MRQKFSVMYGNNAISNYLNRSLVWRKIVLVPVFSLLTALGANIAVPIPGTPVPATLQVPVILLAGAFLGQYSGGASVLLYLLMGIVGMPFFASGASGLARLVGPTGGYLIGFVFGALCVGYLIRLKKNASIWWSAISFFIGLIIIFIFGLLQLRFFTGDILTTLHAGLFPFLIEGIAELIGLTVIYHYYLKRWQFK